MKIFLQTLIPLFFSASAFPQDMPGVEMRAVDYVWERKGGDDRIVFVKEAAYQEILETSFRKAAESRWKTTVPSFEVQVNKLPAFKTQPVLLFYCNLSSDGLLAYRNLNEKQLRIATLLCVLSDKYYQYITL
jgi:hypothetical protein